MVKIHFQSDNNPETNFYLFFASEQTKHLENLNQTLQNRCDQLQNELVVLKDQYDSKFIQFENQLQLQ